MFGFDHYGVVVGVATLCAGVIGQMVIALNWIAYSFGLYYVDTGLAIATGFFIPFVLTLGVWEWENVSDIRNIYQSNTLGSIITYWWCRFAMVSPRRLRMGLEVSGAPRWEGSRRKIPHMDDKAHRCGRPAGNPGTGVHMLEVTTKETRISSEVGM